MTRAALTPELVLYEVALFLLAGSCLLYSAILTQLFGLTRQRLVWILPLVGAVLLLISGGLYGFGAIVLKPLTGADPSVYRQSMMLRTLSISGLLGAGVFASVAGLLVYRGMGDSRT